MTTQDSITTTVRVAMSLRRESQEQLAAVLGVTRSAVSAKLNGHARWSLDDVDRLAEHYGLAPEQLLSPSAALPSLTDGYAPVVLVTAA